MNRDQYYSQTDVVKKYKISIKKLKLLGLSKIEKPIDLGTYSVTAFYYRRADIDQLNLPVR